ncbi:glutamate--tRNA ligase family protein [uncultured Fibrobacter sp.]|uniref:glutamate--tRNA ligase family protein n=1 Tax=uncultured Fibrobacter sp. TaxID=261512 RepID=UPI0025CC461C|nr:glutamate--tRNA ligase family protein [uncultured Fibrobacter sp.]
MCGKIRFAPSPTGYLHEGHLLSALYVWAASHKWNLQVHLRIEDHDRGRARDEYIRSIYEDLAWFGFRWDSQSIQSERESVYRRALESLESRGLVYPCFCSRKQLEEENPKSETGEIVYRGKCLVRREMDAETGMPHNLRVVIPDKVIKWHDLRLGDFAENPKLQCGDFPIRDRDGQWTYQFAVCVDDIDEGITHVVRGEDLRNSTARQIALMELLGRSTPPLYLHHGLITDPTGKKLSKREKAHSLRQDRDSGVSAEELLGRVCFKGGLVPSPAPLSLEQALSAALALL